MFFVYPGEEGPLDSIRTEMMLQGAQDYECLWMIRELLDQLLHKGETERVEEMEERIGEAMELASSHPETVNN
jgi:hypothetical protein